MKWTKQKKEDAIAIILYEVSNGASLRSVLPDSDRVETLPARNTFFSWVDEDTNLANQYARACEARQDVIFEDIFTIADDATNDIVNTENGEKVNHEHIQRSRLRIDARKWALSKMNPKKYGDKIEHSGEIKTGGFDILE